MDDAKKTPVEDTRTARVTAEEALAMHREGRPGKLEIRLTKPLITARDLSLAYSPGVAEPCLQIHRDPSLAYDYTAKGNFVAVISNGTAVLGLGNLGALASKPVMEGKAALFKRFADVDAMDLDKEGKELVFVKKNFCRTRVRVALSKIRKQEAEGCICLNFVDFPLR